jgi:predicted short-subunit dehydrogenase-like oxidoreductase (DUF2520 family)
MRTRLPRILVVGLGRVGTSLARAYQDAGGEVYVLPRSERSLKTARRLGLRRLPHEAKLELCFLTVPDGAVEASARSLAPLLPKGAALVHVAGALTLKDLGEPRTLGGRPRGSFHPLMSVSGSDASFLGRAVALASSNRKTRQALERVARALGLRVLLVSERRRSLYHASAVLAAGGVQALLASAAEGLVKAGVRRDEALQALVPLSLSALEGVAHRGWPEAFTGPVARGDVATVEKNLRALSGGPGELYRLLMRRALEDLALEAHVTRKVERALRPPRR